MPQLNPREGRALRDDIRTVQRHALDILEPNFACPHCGAMYWIEERMINTSKANPSFICCNKGPVRLPAALEYPAEFMALSSNRKMDDALLQALTHAQINDPDFIMNAIQRHGAPLNSSIQVDNVAVLDGNQTAVFYMPGRVAWSTLNDYGNWLIHESAQGPAPRTRFQTTNPIQAEWAIGIAGVAGDPGYQQMCTAITQALEKVHLAFDANNPTLQAVHKVIDPTRYVTFSAPIFRSTKECQSSTLAGVSPSDSLSWFASVRNDQIFTDASFKPTCGRKTVTDEIIPYELAHIARNDVIDIGFSIRYWRNDRQSGLKLHLNEVILLHEANSLQGSSTSPTTSPLRPLKSKRT